jgi:hypothetical protein
MRLPEWLASLRFTSVKRIPLQTTFHLILWPRALTLGEG